MNHLLKSLACIFISLHLSAQGIRFEEKLSWEKILQKAKLEQKYIFVDCYASWCGPCKTMEKYVYPDSSLASYMNKGFISIKFQMDSTAKDNPEIRNRYSDAKRLGIEYKVNAYPTFLFFSPSGKIIHRGLGFKEAADFHSLADEALNPKKQFYTLKSQFENNQLPLSETGSFAILAAAIGDDQLAVAAAKIYKDKFLFAGDRGNDSLLTLDNIDFLFQFTSTVEEKSFKVIESNTAAIDSVGGPGTAEKFLIKIINKEKVQPAKLHLKTDQDWEVLLSGLEKQHGLFGKLAVLQEKLITKIQSTDTAGFAKSYQQYFKIAGELNIFRVAIFSAEIEKRVNDKEILQFALQTMNHYKNPADPNDLAIYAKLLWATGDSQAAKD